MQNYYDLQKGVTASNLAHLYSRVSSARQVDGTGLDRQSDTTEAYRERMGLTIVKSYTDAGVSAIRGANRRKGELGTILKAIESGVIKPGEPLIIEAMDRLSREPPMEAFDTLKTILKKGIVVHTVMDQRFYTYQSLNTDLGQLILVLFSMARANEEVRVRGKRVADAWVQKREDNEILTSKVPGWLMVVPKSDLTDPVEIAHAKKFKGDRAFTVNKHRLGLLKWMFEQVAAGVSPHAVARMLNDQGETPWGNQRKASTGIHRWTSTTIVHIITSKNAVGEYRSNAISFDEDGKRHLHLAKVIADYYLPVIDPGLWMRANAAVAKRKRTFERGNTGEEFANLFQHIATCHHCGGPMYLKHNSGPSASNPYRKKYTFFRCHARSDGKCTNHRTVKYAHFEAEFLEWVAEIDLTDNRSAEIGEIEKRIADQTLKIESLNSEIDRIIQGYGDTKRGNQMVKEKEAEIETIEMQLSADRDALALAQTVQSPQDRKEALKQLITKMSTADKQERFQIRAAMHQKIREVVSKIEFHQDGHIFAYLHDKPGTQYRFYESQYAGVRRFQDKFREYMEAA